MNAIPEPPTVAIFARINIWLAARVWIPIAVLVGSVLLLGFALLLLVGRVNDNSTKLSELRYRSCIEDAVLDFKIAEGSVVEAAFSRDEQRTGELLVPYRESLDRLRGAESSCRAKFPDT